jgi:hypothetical protein
MFLNVFGESLIHSIRRKSYNGIPYPLYHAISIIEASYLDEEGIYKLAPDRTETTTVLSNMHQGIYTNNISGPMAACCVKVYLGKLPQRIIPQRETEKLLAVMKEERDILPQISYILNTLPLENRVTLGYILRHLAKVGANQAKNFMHTNNLAIVFTNYLFEVNVEHNVLEYLKDLPILTKCLNLLINNTDCVSTEPNALFVTLPRYNIDVYFIFT